MSSPFSWTVGGCCCAVPGPWDYYGEVDAYQHPYLPRLASVYFWTPPPSDSWGESIESDRWYVTIPNKGDGADFQTKLILSAIAAFAPSTERVYFYCQDYGAGHSRKPKFLFDDDEEGFTRHADNGAKRGL